MNKLPAWLRSFLLVFFTSVIVALVSFLFFLSVELTSSLGIDGRVGPGVVLFLLAWFIAWIVESDK